jgi:hypothetical protein
MVGVWQVATRSKGFFYLDLYLNKADLHICKNIKLYTYMVFMELWYMSYSVIKIYGKIYTSGFITHFVY